MNWQGTVRIPPCVLRRWLTPRNKPLVFFPGIFQLSREDICEEFGWEWYHVRSTVIGDSQILQAEKHDRLLQIYSVFHRVILENDSTRDSFELAFARSNGENLFTSRVIYVPPGYSVTLFERDITHRDVSETFRRNQKPTEYTITDISIVLPGASDADTPNNNDSSTAPLFADELCKSFTVPHPDLIERLFWVVHANEEHEREINEQLPRILAGTTDRTQTRDAWKMHSVSMSLQLVHRVQKSDRSVRSGDIRAKLQLGHIESNDDNPLRFLCSTQGVCAHAIRSSMATYLTNTSDHDGWISERIGIRGTVIWHKTNTDFETFLFGANAEAVEEPQAKRVKTEPV